MKRVRIGIVGARTFRSQTNVVSLVHQLVDRYGAKNFVLVSGGCYGVDNWAVCEAKQLGVYCDVIRPVFPAGSPYTIVRRALLARNVKLVNSCNKVYAFLGSSGLVGGTGHSVSVARRLGIPVILIRERGGNYEFNF